MNFRKALVGALGAAAFCGALVALPQASDAAVVKSIEPLKAGDTTLDVTYTNASAGDEYEIWKNGTRINAGSLDAEYATSGNQSKRLDFWLYTSDKDKVPVKEGDKITFYFENNKVFNKTELTVGAGSTDPEPDPDTDAKLPTSMVADKSSVAASDNASVSLTFDKNYVPHKDDRVKVTRYDANNKVLDSYEVDLPDANNGAVTVSLSESKETAYYLIDFVPGQGTSTLKSVRVDVTSGSGGDGPSQSDQEQIANATEMRFSYPSSKVSPGESVTPTIQLVDKNGNAKDYTGPVVFSYSGAAVVADSFDSNGRFTVSSDQGFAGNKIWVTAMIGKKFSKTVELTVQAADKGLILSPKTGGIGKARTVTFGLTDASGNRLRLKWEPTMAQVVIKSADGNTSAKYSGTVTDLSKLTTSGEGKILISGDTAGTANIYLTFKDGSGSYYETGISEYEFTETANPVDIYLNINSPYYTVNGISYTADTSPVVSSNRTFVPLRLLGETLGADVKWNGTDRTITSTYKANDKTITVVMTVGSTTYTIDGASKTMDVAPYVNSDGRTMIPLRVLAESFGCEVEAISSNDLTTGVQVTKD
ncbi:MAG: copper amine oxidase N-terminal domain-containing protein [Peptococcaceae bacterium]|nr:copper amine oxidase N-terminal domain-containing protein [Peptococcaceae bacterium]